MFIFRLIRKGIFSVIIVAVIVVAVLFSGCGQFVQHNADSGNNQTTNAEYDGFALSGISNRGKVTLEAEKTEDGSFLVTADYAGDEDILVFLSENGRYVDNPRLYSYVDISASTIKGGEQFIVSLKVPFTDYDYINVCAVVDGETFSSIMSVQYISPLTRVFTGYVYNDSNGEEQLETELDTSKSSCTIYSPRRYEPLGDDVLGLISAAGGVQEDYSVKCVVEFENGQSANAFGISASDFRYDVEGDQTDYSWMSRLTADSIVSRLKLFGLTNDRISEALVNIESSGYSGFKISFALTGLITDYTFNFSTVVNIEL